MITELERPLLLALRLETFDDSSWPAIAAAFADAPRCPLQQAWRTAPQPAFRPATAAAASCGTELLVFAELEDDDIFNPATVLNEAGFTQGDVFEMFLRPGGQDAYYELHVSPQNQQFQLRIPSAAIFADPARRNPAFESWKITEPLFQSRVNVDHDAQQWQVLARVPANRLSEQVAFGPGVEWTFSFSRYDYTRGVTAPVISSTSPHPVPNFHHQAEWGTLRFG